MQSTETSGLSQGLDNRHIQFLALGGAIGTGLFLGSARVLELAGPSMLMGYAIVGGVVFLIMRFLGEMLVEEPVSHSFSYFAGRYWGNFAGFFAGWNTIALYVLAGMLELSAAGAFVQFWWPGFPTWITAAVGLVVVHALNLISVRIYGEVEFWMASIKVLAVLAMIGFGVYLLVANYGRPGVGIDNLWRFGGFMPGGFGGLVQALGLIAFSYVGLEMMTFAAAETRDPGRAIPKAINQIAYRILIFYMGSTFVLLTIFAWPALLHHMQGAGGIYGSSPFALVLSMAGSHRAADLLNLVILAAALSVYNSAIYSSSRMLFGMAREGNAPAALGRASARGVPVRALLLSALASGVAVSLNYLMPGHVIEVLIALISTSFVLMWTVIVITHFKFRQAMARSGVRTAFPAPLGRLAHALCLLLVVLVVVVMVRSPGMREGAYAIPLWVAAVWLGYRAVGRHTVRRQPDTPMPRPVAGD